MQIVPSHAHYQLVYSNFNFSSFSLTSCTAIVRSSAFLDHPFPFSRFSKVGNAHEGNTSVGTNVEGVNTKP